MYIHVLLLLLFPKHVFSSSKYILKFRMGMGWGFGVMVFNTTFNNISAIEWQSVLLVEETGVCGGGGVHIYLYEFLPLTIATVVPLLQTEAHPYCNEKVAL